MIAARALRGYSSLLDDHGSETTSRLLHSDLCLHRNLLPIRVVGPPITEHPHPLAEYRQVSLVCARLS
jgi:hypothetical protein